MLDGHYPTENPHSLLLLSSIDDLSALSNSQVSSYLTFYDIEQGDLELRHGHFTKESKQEGVNRILKALGTPYIFM